MRGHAIDGVVALICRSIGLGPAAARERSTGARRRARPRTPVPDRRALRGSTLVGVLVGVSVSASHVSAPLAAPPAPTSRTDEWFTGWFDPDDGASYLNSSPPY